ncbi:MULTISPECIES: isocitrate/isopropylmalate dehydrogenase family protein [unclassified Ruegeria]|uniref:isocitrate/isopropylmalate dehydrogenase family protein n=1 Tax=unclassified Ruegeria TaxID=2625375 RepID=UPI001490AB43|nr:MULTISPECIES: isocitrate/isopropylmalate family dehydrogenase [unclassified Ruegeria]NOC85890.1 isocitrate/isopropylmalate dehydrogenase family protein [Ruegeria sp. HKCCD6428]NOE27854.1 isocitrate/isopropylmalate dehydrogenase family protein [Ruegeria sp. HKCCD6157]
MKKTYDIAVFHGDGIGPEIMAPTLEILRHLSRGNPTYELAFTDAPAGAGHYAKTGESFPTGSLETARKADAILLSAMGLPDVRYPDGTEISPQIDLRKQLGLFAGVRPVKVSSGQMTPLALPPGKEIDFVLIRESTEGLFFTQGTGEVTEDEARETLLITREVSEKLFRFAFDLANNRKASGRGPGRVTCVDKANVFRAFAFFRSIFDAEAARHPDLQADHAYVDATALWMVQKPWEFDVLVTENMFGDILSDLGAGLMGGLGLAPSADIGLNHAVFQPCHGSAPDIAGQGVANPFAMFLSAAMMLEWLGLTHDHPELSSDGARLREAVEKVVANGQNLTRDLGGKAGTQEAASAVLEALPA